MTLCRKFFTFQLKTQMVLYMCYFKNQHSFLDYTVAQHENFKKQKSSKQSYRNYKLKYGKRGFWNVLLVENSFEFWHFMKPEMLIFNYSQTIFGCFIENSRNQGDSLVVKGGGAKEKRLTQLCSTKTFSIFTTPNTGHTRSIRSLFLIIETCTYFYWLSRQCASQFFLKHS